MNNLVTSGKDHFWDLDLPKFHRHSVLGDFPFMDLFKTDFSNTKYPPCNVRETENGFHVEMSVPGWSKENLEVTLKNNILRLKGTKRDSTESEDVKYHYKELSTKAFERAFTIGKNLEVGKVYLKDVLLNVELNRLENFEADTRLFPIE